MAVWLSLLATSAHGAPAVNEEDVPVILQNEKVQCSDRIPDPGFGAVPAALFIDAKDVFDRTLRTAGVSFYTQLPDTTTCAQLEPELKRMKSEFTVKRKWNRIIESTWDGRRTYSRLPVELLLEIDVQIDGKSVVLTGTDDWLEDIGPASDKTIGKRLLPVTHTYTTRTHRQSATDTVGLFCKATAGGSAILTLGRMSEGGNSNTDMVRKSFASLADCDDARQELLTEIEVEDPGNWGTLANPKRVLERRYRYILDNMARPVCQQIQLETVTIDFRGHKLRGASTFIEATVDMDECIANANTLTAL